MPPRTKSPGTHVKRLFAEPERPTDFYIAHIDGASRGNPGPASYAAIVRKPNGEMVARVSKYIGRATNNVAEYYGLIAALDYVIAHKIPRLMVLSDSQLLVNQMRGIYKVKDAQLKQLHENAKKLVKQLAYFGIEHIYRERNADADQLANEILNRTSKAGSDRAGAAESRAAQPMDTSAAGAKPSVPPAAEKRIRAHFWDGVLVPEDPLDLLDGDKVELIIHPRKS